LVVALDKGKEAADYNNYDGDGQPDIAFAAITGGVVDAHMLVNGVGWLPSRLHVNVVSEN
jgi:hypothetical protein